MFYEFNFFPYRKTPHGVLNNQDGLNMKARKKKNGMSAKKH